MASVDIQLQKLSHCCWISVCNSLAHCYFYQYDILCLQKEERSSEQKEEETRPTKYENKRTVSIYTVHKMMFNKSLALSEKKT